MDQPSKNRCRTYFRIMGDFDPGAVSEILGIAPEEQRKAGERGDFASFSLGNCSEYDVYTENQMRKTLAPLLGKEALLQKIREENDVSFVLAIVPELYAGEIAPCLAPPPDVIDFCHATRTEIDIDLYLYNSEDE